MICLASLAPLGLFLFVLHEPTPTLSFRGSFGPVTHNLARIVRDRQIWRMMALFACAVMTLLLAKPRKDTVHVEEATEPEAKIAA
jgi:hypothetical protein